ncbi:TrlF family AAA-like ATPase [Deinococcota bacterium DY0809b]
MDLHLHSPGVSSFSFPPGLDANQRDRVVAQYVDQLKKYGIEVAAITDYQQIRTEWYTPIREAALKEGIYIYPGVELSFGGGTAGKSGLHVLAIFPFDADVQDMNRAVEKLLDVSKEPLIYDGGGHRDIKLDKPVQDGLRQLREETGCIIIFPHPNDSKGLLKSYRPKAAAEILAVVLPEAIEELSEKGRKSLRDTQEIVHEDINRIASVSSSDNHSIQEIGTKQRRDEEPRATYLKLSALKDLTAIRLALRDHSILVQLGGKTQQAYTLIKKVEVDGDGFLGGVSLAMSSELNVFIGGRGVGKSALLEVIRYGLDLPEYKSSEAETASSKYRSGLVRYALGSGGKVVVYLHYVIKPGVERYYRVERVWGEEAQVYELSDSGASIVDLSIRNLLKEGRPLFFGQRVLYEVAQSPELRRRFLDDLIGYEAQKKEREIEAVRQEIGHNTRKLLEAKEEHARLDEKERNLREVNHELKLFEERGLAEKLQEEAALARDDERLKRTETIPNDLRKECHEIQKSWKDRLKDALADLSKAESQQRDLLQRELAGAIRELQDGLEKVFQQVNDLLQKTEHKLGAVRQRWNEEYRKYTEALRNIRQDLEKLQETSTETLDLDRFIRLTREKERLMREIDSLKRVSGRLQDLANKRDGLLQKLRALWREAFRLREDQAKVITSRIGQRVKVETIYRAQREEYANKLKSFFDGSGMLKKDIEKIAKNKDIADGIALAELVHKGKTELMSKTGLSEAQVDRLVSYLEQKESRLYELELLSPEDEVSVSLNVGGRWVPLEYLSAGQRATAMLLILLTQTRQPLLIDQPEDDLDNRFIYEDIVKLLREQKGARQVVVATHNPNIPVLAHGELVGVLEAENERARVGIQGGMDRREVQDEVRRIMEGGDEAFRRRAEKYGWG